MEGVSKITSLYKRLLKYLKWFYNKYTTFGKIYMLPRVLLRKEELN